MSTQTKPIVDKVMELRAVILTTEFEKAMEGLVQDERFEQTVKRRTEAFIERYGKPAVAGSNT